MKRNTTEVDRLAAKMGYRIKHKHDGRFEVVLKNGGGYSEPFSTMAEVEDVLKREWETGGR